MRLQLVRALALAVLLPLGCRAPAPAAAAASASSASARVDDEVHGTLEIVEGQPVLRVWGTPRQMGFAHGVLLRARILEVVEHYALDVVPPATLAATASVMGRVAAIPPTLREEAAGIVEGMRHAGGAHVAALDRELVVEDLLVLNAMTDLLAVGCSSMSAWGGAAAGELAGHPAVVRNLDWSDDPELLANQIVIVTTPADPRRRPLVSVAFAGYIGCLSCMNDAGVTALFHMGYGDGAVGLAGARSGFAPANLLLRDALERGDVDGDGVASALDVERIVRGATHVGSWIAHVLEPSATARTSGRAPARILEIEADGVVTRTADERPLGPELLAATNHLRAKAQPQACPRYARIERRARSHARRFDRAALWTLGRDLRLPAVVHTMIVEPDARRLALWLRGPEDAPTSTAAAVLHEWTTLQRPH